MAIRRSAAAFGLVIWYLITPPSPRNDLNNSRRKLRSRIGSNSTPSAR